MGWWTEEKNGQVIDIGDGPLDVVHTALKKIVSAYKRELKRKPTPEELASILESGIRILEEDLFADMEEREVDQVTIGLRVRPRRPKPKPGDYFAVPLPSGGYGYGRVMKIDHRVLVWVRLLDLHTEELASVETVKKAQVILDCYSATNKMLDMTWPLVGYEPLTEGEKTLLKSEPEWMANYADWRVQRILDWMLSGKPGFPPNTPAPY